MHTYTAAGCLGGRGLVASESCEEEGSQHLDLDATSGSSMAGTKAAEPQGGGAQGDGVQGQAKGGGDQGGGAQGQHSGAQHGGAQGQHSGARGQHGGAQHSGAQGWWRCGWWRLGGGGCWWLQAECLEAEGQGGDLCRRLREDQEARMKKK